MEGNLPNRPEEAGTDKPRARLPFGKQALRSVAIIRRPCCRLLRKCVRL